MQNVVSVLMGHDWKVHVKDFGLTIEHSGAAVPDIGLWWAMMHPFVWAVQQDMWNLDFLAFRKPAIGFDDSEDDVPVFPRVHPGALWEIHRMRRFHLSVRANTFNHTNHGGGVFWMVWVHGD